MVSKLGATLLALLLALTCDACATTSSQHVAPNSKERLVGNDHGRVNPLSLTREMEAWVQCVAPKWDSAEVRLRGLLNLLLSPEGLHIKQVFGPTNTAAQTFERRNANCTIGETLGFDIRSKLSLPEISSA